MDPHEEEVAVWDQGDRSRDVVCETCFAGSPRRSAGAILEVSERRVGSAQWLIRHQPYPIGGAPLSAAEPRAAAFGRAGVARIGRRAPHRWRSPASERL